ncbi:MAG: hypothetical protein AVO33_05520 [delta proteobacterium ML8_F1]|nr:MAG: hypothetical protein AVO33_05520 [delta proteobacterium ML8_F1]
MGVIFIAVTLGGVLGFFLKWNDFLKKTTSNLQLVGLSVLLFFMGVSVGSNPDIIDNLSLIGLKSFSFGLLSVFFSVITIYAATSIFKRRTS